MFSWGEIFPGNRVFCKTQGNSVDLSATMFFSVSFVFFSCFQVGFKYLLMLRSYVLFVAFRWGETEFVAVAFLSVIFCLFTIPSNK